MNTVDNIRPIFSHATCPTCGGILRPSMEPLHRVFREHEAPAYCEDCGERTVARKKDLKLWR